MTYDPSIGDGAQLMDILQLQSTLAGYSLVDPTDAKVTPGADPLTIDVAAAPSGVRLGGNAVDFSGETNVGLPAVDPTQPRKVFVYLGETANVVTLGGDPDDPVPSDEIRESTTTPHVPTPDEAYLPLAEVWLAAGATDIVADDIVDRRIADNAGTPTGVISMWSGSIADTPGGWTLCDGTDGAPDLRDRFVVGAGNSYSVGDTGGEKEHQLTEDELPSHNHSYTAPSGTNTNGTANQSVVSGTTSDTTGNTGNDQAHENRPPYFAVAYIMKL